MIISLLVAMDEKGAIGQDNRLPWRLSGDLRWFKELTMGHHILMGRKTWESIGKALPGRTSIIISRNLTYCPVGAYAVRSLDEGLALAKSRGEDEAFVIGGAEIFGLALPRADKLYLTRVHAVVPADVYFPAFDESQWVEEQAEYHPADERNEYPFTLKVLRRKEAGVG